MNLESRSAIEKEFLNARIPSRSSDGQMTVDSDRGKSLGNPAKLSLAIPFISETEISAVGR